MTDNRPMQAGDVSYSPYLDKNTKLPVYLDDTSKYTLGCDISHWNTVEGTRIDFKKMKAAGIKFVIIKATDGINLDWIDPQFEYNWKASRDEGLLRAPYHFFTMDNTGVHQADCFEKVVEGLGWGELPAILDYEIKNGTIAETLNWLILVKHYDENENMPVVYTSINYWFNPPPVWTANHDLHVAHWGADNPAIPPGWGTKGWKFWQWSATAKGSDYGATSRYIDLDWFNGTEAELIEYANGVEPIPEPPDEDNWYEMVTASLRSMNFNIPDPPTGEPIPPNTPDSFYVVANYTLFIRNRPAGAAIGSLGKDTRVEVIKPTQYAIYSDNNYEWGHILKPMDGWIAISHGLTKPG